jgi:hypothetical protein
LNDDVDVERGRSEIDHGACGELRLDGAELYYEHFLFRTVFLALIA